MSEPIPTTYHFSLGSAATGVHVSVDIDANDPDLVKKFDKFVEFWAKTVLVRSKYDGMLKGKV